MNKTNLNIEKIIEVTNSKLETLIHKVETELTNQGIKQHIADEILYILSNETNNIMAYLTGFAEAEKEKQNTIAKFKGV